MKMIGHQIIPMHLPIRFAANITQHFDEAKPIHIITENPFTPTVRFLTRLVAL
jgi:hypothetical protein